MFAEERPALLPLPLEPFRYYQFGQPTVHLDGCVEVEAASYQPVAKVAVFGRSQAALRKHRKLGKVAEATSGRRRMSPNFLQRRFTSFQRPKIDKSESPGRP